MRETPQDVFNTLLDALLYERRRPLENRTMLNSEQIEDRLAAERAGWVARYEAAIAAATEREE